MVSWFNFRKADIGLKSSPWNLTAALMVVIVAPALSYYLGIASSHTAGTALAAIAVFVGGALFASTRGLPIYVYQCVAAVLAFSVAHALLILAIGPFDMARAFPSLVVLCTVIVAAGFIANITVGLHDRDVLRAVNVVFVFLLVVGILGAIGIVQPFAEGREKTVFPFTEPAAYALTFTPFLIFKCAMSRPRWRLAYLLAAVLVAIILQNLTLLVGCLLVIGLCYRLRYAAILAAFGLVAVWATDIDYYAERLNLADDTRNLSALVYLQGWQIISNALTTGDSIGVGFQQLGLAGQMSDASELIYRLTGDSLNTFDGSFMTAKIIGEFGVFGIIPLFFLVAMIVKCSRQIRRITVGGEPASNARALGLSLVAAYVCDVFLRTAGYLTATSFLLATGLVINHLLSRRVSAKPMTAYIESRHETAD